MCRATIQNQNVQMNIQWTKQLHRESPTHEPTQPSINPVSCQRVEMYQLVGEPLRYYVVYMAS